MRVLGVHDGHTATAALLEDGKIVSVISEERINRVKEWHGFPRKAIQRILKINRISLQDIDLVVVAGKAGSTTYKDFMGERLHPYIVGFDLFKSIVPATLMKKNWWVKPVITFAAKLRKKKEIYDFFEAGGLSAEKIIFADHHTCHAYATFSNTWGQKEDMLILTLDAAGDGYSGSVNVFNKGKFKTLERTNIYNSLGFLYSRLTQYLGMRALSHEYKVMGLAAYTKEQDKEKVYEVLRTKFMRVDPKNPLRLENLSGAVNRDYLRAFDRYFKFTRFDHLAGGAQKLVEELVLQLVKNAIATTGIKNVFCSGGVFMNVKANMRVLYESGAERLFIVPSCGDESNSIGACNYGYRLLCKKSKINFAPAPLTDIYFGNDISEDEIKNAIKKYEDKINVRKIDHINKFVARLIAQENIVARCSGKMEFGARALGNRSILANPFATGVTREINEAIKQRDFWMPFACTVLDKDEQKYLLCPKNYPAHYMIICFDTKKPAHKELINGMHQYDLTARPQILKKEHNREYYEILEEFRKITGTGGILNTSFNIHGEPVVSTAEDAISTLMRSGLKHLVIEDYYITKK